MPAAEALESSFTMNGQENLQQMDASTFLPLILQAQDLVAKLENRVVELENDLEVCITTLNLGHYLNIKLKFECKSREIYFEI
jgi:hypothetical protein